MNLALLASSALKGAPGSPPREIPLAGRSTAINRRHRSTPLRWSNRTSVLAHSGGASGRPAGPLTAVLPSVVGVLRDQATAEPSRAFPALEAINRLSAIRESQEVATHFAPFLDEMHRLRGAPSVCSIDRSNALLRQEDHSHEVGAAAELSVNCAPRPARRRQVRRRFRCARRPHRTVNGLATP